jgi:hypothetical protein
LKKSKVAFGSMQDALSFRFRHPPNLNITGLQIC